MPRAKKKAASGETPKAPSAAVKEQKALEKENLRKEKRIAELESQIRKRMPSVNLLKSSPLGSLRRQREWETRTRPLIAELETILQRRTSVEYLRPAYEAPT